MTEKLTCYIIDDEEHAINSLEFLLDYYCNRMVESVGYASNYEEGIAYLAKNSPDILFLDISLGEKSGFDLLKEIGKLSDTHIVITTAYDEYALDAFKFNAINYLLKPVNPEELQEVIAKIKDRLLRSNATSINNLLTNQRERLFFPYKDGYNSVLFSDIIYIEAGGANAEIHLKNGEKIAVNKNLLYFENLLKTNSEFIRVHKSYIVNANHIVRFDKQNKLKICLTNEIEIPVSPLMKQAILSYIGF
ncbi:MAG: response regulator transcription factor [Flavobacterium sp.]|nr:MAG: response regulator transcription factor [Flavobacterium sp.]